MKMQDAADNSIGRVARWPILVSTILTMGVSLMPEARAQAGDAEKLLKAMSDYVASQKAASVTFDSDIEVITSSLQKIQFTSSGQVQLSRPDKLRATRTGGYRDIEIVFDGKMLTVNNKDSKDYAQIDAPGTADQLIDVLRDRHGVVAPGADLLLSNVYDVRSQADPAQIRDYQQGHRRGAAIHAAHQGMEDRPAGGCLCIQAGYIRQEDRARRSR
jgi:hypothetical protein